MSPNGIRQEINVIGHEVYERFLQQDCVTVQFEGRPDTRIFSLDPFTYDPLKRRQRPYFQSDEYPVVTLLPRTFYSGDSVGVELVLETSRGFYGHTLNNMNVLNFIARSVGRFDQFTRGAR